MVRANGVMVDDEKVRAICECPPQSTIHNVRSSLGLATFYPIYKKLQYLDATNDLEFEEWPI